MIPDIAPKIRLSYYIGAAVTFGAPLLFYCIGYTSGSLDLDKSTNKVSLTAKMTAFLPAQTRTIGLDSVQSAVLDYKPNSRRIRLNVSNGQDLAYPIWSDRPGQQEAVDAINLFLQGSHKS